MLARVLVLAVVSFPVLVESAKAAETENPQILTPSAGDHLPAGWSGPLEIDFSNAPTGGYDIGIHCSDYSWGGSYTNTEAGNGHFAGNVPEISRSREQSCQISVTDSATSGANTSVGTAFTVAATPRGECPAAVGHRGTTQTGFTEESVNAEVLAVTLGAEYAEVDVQASKNGVLYVMHDQTLDRTSNGHGRIRNLTSTQINRYRLNDGSRIPHLGDVFDALKPTAGQVYVELKAPGEAYQRIATRIREFGVSRVVVNSFHTGRLDRIRKLMPHVRLNLDSGKQVPVSTLTPYQSVFVHSSAVTPEYVAAVHAAHLGVWVYGVADTIEGYESVPAGVDGISTNDVATYQGWCATSRA